MPLVYYKIVSDPTSIDAKAQRRASVWGTPLPQSQTQSHLVILVAVQYLLQPIESVVIVRVIVVI